VLKEGPYASDQATSDTSYEYDDFEISCGKDVKIFDELMRPRGSTQCFDVPPKIFDNS